MRRTNGILAGALAATIAVGAHAGDCALLPNGDFESGLDGWTAVPALAMTGDGFAGATADTFVPGAPQFENTAAILSIFATAGDTDGNGFASAEIVLRRTLVVTGTTLEMAKGGFWEFLVFGNAGRSIEALLVVEGPDDAIASTSIGASADTGGPGCGPGLSILGTFEEPPSVSVDLAGAGIPIGSMATVSIILRGTARAVEACQSAETSGFVAIDLASFCGVAVPGDVDGDGIVNVADLVAVILAWGACPPPAPTCPADLDGSGFVDVADLVEVVLNWTG